MGLHYYAEYSLGHRGGRICRSRTGIPAFVAIAVDLLLSLVFGIVGIALHLAWFLLRTGVHFAALVLTAASLLAVAIFRFLVAVVEAPVRAIQRQRRRGDGPSGAFAKPAWAGFEEV